MSLGRLAGLAIGIALVVIVLGPLALLFATSLKGDPNQILRDLGNLNAFWIAPSDISFANYRDVLNDRQSPFLVFMMNSILIVAGIVASGVFVNSMAAFALARLRFKGRQPLLAVIVALIIIPIEALAVPLLIMSNRMGLLETLIVQIVPFIAHPFSIYLFYQFFTKLPKDLDEAALVEGATPFQIYSEIVMPLSGPVVATVAILQSLQYWNAYLWPLMVTRGPEARPVSLALAQFFGTPPPAWGQLMAFSVMMSLPILVVYLIFQRWFIQSVVSSAVKG
jgi:multiple sugar transport system permease protein